MTLMLTLDLDLDMYSLFQKKRTFNSTFFRGPRGEGGPKIHMVDYVNRPCEFLVPIPLGGQEKNRN